MEERERALVEKKTIDRVCYVLDTGHTVNVVKITLYQGVCASVGSISSCDQ